MGELLFRALKKMRDPVAGRAGRAAACTLFVSRRSWFSSIQKICIFRSDNLNHFATQMP
ncbi:hypothetical protein [Burkholderia cepacia]|uniref:hypothetical protein n=1 Tax=Burkholderia cepacia TaxID=292 RepID=UPI00398F8C3A